MAKTLKRKLCFLFRTLNGKLDTYNNQLTTINTRLETIERHMKQEKRKGQAPVKPNIIPMQTVQEVIDFDNANDVAYDGLVGSLLSRIFLYKCFHLF